MNTEIETVEQSSPKPSPKAEAKVKAKAKSSVDVRSLPPNAINREGKRVRKPLR